VELRVASADPAEVLKLVESGGPYYLYGRGASAVKGAVSAKYGEMMALPGPLAEPRDDAP
jgi:hypothetical protein